MCIRDNASTIRGVVTNSTVDDLCRNFLSPDFWTKFRKEGALIFRDARILITTQTQTDRLVQGYGAIAMAYRTGPIVLA